ncbi:MAG TPA: DUF4339 domain-containing protein [Thermoanaerobaculia bacterium]|nr:DUF4339 domain-containing protein [Thermoanaerobaculia bacterium]
MGTQWFYLEGEQRRGPLTLEELVRALVATPDPHSVRVWDPRMADWQPAGSVVEIAGQLPPPRVPLVPRDPAVKPLPFEEAESIAKLYRRLVLLVGAQLLLGYVIQVVAAAVPSTGVAVISLVGLAVLIGVMVTVAVTAYRLACHLGTGVPAFWAVSMFLPCLNILFLLILSAKAQVWCKQYGIKVGFFGPTKESIEELKRRGMTSAFD